MSESAARQFQVGGAVIQGAFYVTRAADQELLESLRSMEFCYVLAPRQIGKSSLRVRTKQVLEQEHVQCATIDLTTIGSRDCTAEQWYFGIIDELSLQLNLDKPDHYWQQHILKSPVHRFSHYMREILRKISAQIVIFIDELDAILSQPGISRDDFFAAVRAFYNARVEDPAYRRLTFCLIGVALPSDLIADETRTPFNIGRCITLDDFTREELNEFLPGIQGGKLPPQTLLDDVFSWTHGHPYMTQKLCHALALDDVAPSAEIHIVDYMVNQIFLYKGRVLEPNLSFAEKIFYQQRNTPRTLSMLRLYGRLRAGEQISAHGQDALQMALRLTGIAAERREESGTWLRVRNRIFETVFDQSWVRQQESDRLITEPLSRWLESNRSEDYVLRGQALEAARQWSRRQSELTAEEGAFLLASVDVAEREVLERQERDATRLAAEHARQENVRLAQQVESARTQQRNILLIIEIFERFAFYLVISLLILYINERLGWSVESALRFYGWFMFFVYTSPIFGGLIADRLIGYRCAVLSGTCLLGVGYFLLAWPNPTCFYLSLVFLTIGNGLYKPNIMTLFGYIYPQGDPRRDSAFVFFYMGINLGAFLAPQFGGALRQNLGWAAAFSVSGISMIISTVIFLIFRYLWAPVRHPSCIIDSDKGTDNKFKKSPHHSQPSEWKRIIAFTIMCIIIVIFWSSFQQSGNTFLLWARDNTDRSITIVDFDLWFKKKPQLTQLEIPSVVFSSINPILVILLAPALMWLMQRLHKADLEPSTTYKICIGMVLTCMAYTIMIVGALHGMNHGKASMWWLVSAYFVISIAELLISPMVVSAVTTLAPQRMTAMLMGLYLTSITVGNWIAGKIGNRLWNRWTHENFFGLIAAIALGSAVLLFLNQRRIASAIESEVIQPKITPSNHI